VAEGDATLWLKKDAMFYSIEWWNLRCVFCMSVQYSCAVLPQASLQKSLDSQKQVTKSEKNSLDLKLLRRNLQVCLK